MADGADLPEYEDHVQRMEKKPARVVILGASDLQLPLIEKAKSLGYETHVFAWAAGDVGERAADVFYPISLTETERILAVCRRLRPAAVATIASDLAAVTAVKLTNALGLPGNPPDTALLAANKAAMRAAFAKAGLPTPWFRKLRRGDPLPDPGDIPFPVVVKPTDRSGSRGIFQLTSPDRLAESVAFAREESFEKAAILEAFIEGKEYSCECISENGKHEMLAVTEKYTTGAPHFIEIGHIQPSGLSKETEAAVQKVVFRALDALRIRTGASHTEFKITPAGEIRLIEAGARMGGDCIGSDLVHLTTGFDYLKMVLDDALGNPLDRTKGDTVPAAAVRYILTQADWNHYQLLKQTHPEAILRENLHFDPSLPVVDSASRSGFYIVKASSRAEAQSLSDLNEAD